jgi:hypothetical protein
VVRRSIVASILVVGFCLLAPAIVGAQDAEPSGGLRGIKIPNPLGLGLTFYNQTQPYQIDSLEVQFPGLDPSLLQDFEVANETTSYHIRLDYWVLPFLNIFGMVGNIDSSTPIGLSGLDIGLPFAIKDLTVSLDGTVYGGGLVLAVGGEKWFATVAADITETDLDVADSSVSAWVVTPKVGLRLSRGAVWIGAMYQRAEEEHRGVFELPFVGQIPFQVKLRELEPWNYTIGGTAGLGEHWVLILQGGFGDRKSALATIEYRF